MIPTPLDAVRRAAGIAEVVRVEDLPEEVVANKPPILGRILGALFYRTRTVYLDSTEPEPRVRFTYAHEITHKLVPWHEDSHRLDDKGRVFGPIRAAVEAEANIGAAQILFQGSAFMTPALGYRLTLDAPLALAGDFGASRHAAIRYYVENHPDRVALVVGGRYLSSRGDLPAWVGVQSPGFLARYGRAIDIVGPRIPATIESALGEIVAEALGSSEVERGQITVCDRGGRERTLTAEGFFNQHCTFLLLAETGLIQLGKRIVVARSLPSQAIAQPS